MREIPFCIKRSLTSLSCLSVFVFPLVHVLLVLAFLLVLLLAEKYETVGGGRGQWCDGSPLCCFGFVASEEISVQCVVSFPSASLPFYQWFTIRKDLS